MAKKAESEPPPENSRSARMTPTVAKKIAGLSDAAKQVARETGLDENREVLLEAAKAQDSVAFLREESARRDTKKGAERQPRSQRSSKNSPASDVAD